jgi:putative acetyltransferase
VRKDNIVIREIVPEDDSKIAATIREVLIEFGVPKVGTAYEDTTLDMMFNTYNLEGSKYFVVEEKGVILGGAGIAPLAGAEELSICELQKMYFKKQIRGRGVGFEMMNTCLKFAKSAGYKQCYLETMPYMDEAQKLYHKVGFKSLQVPLGNTGHYSCTVWMIKDL